MKNKKLIISLIACALVAGAAFAVVNSQKEEDAHYDVSLLDVATIDGDNSQTSDNPILEIEDEETPLATIGKNKPSSVKNLSTSELDKIRTYLINSTNKERKTKAANKLVVEYSKLKTTGNIRAKEIVQKWSHTRPNGQSWSTVLSANGITQSNLKAGENLAKIAMTAKSSYSTTDLNKLCAKIHESLMNSKTHRKVILNQNYDELGIGVYSQLEDGKVYVYVTEHFKNKNVSTIPVSKFKLSTVKNPTYTGKQIKPSITVKYNNKTLKNGTDYTVSYGANKNPGEATIKITGKGSYSGTLTKKFYILPKTPTSLKVTAASKSMKVSYGKSTGASGYEIAYSTNKTKGFKNVSLTGASKSITKLASKKTYYVKVRAYKTVGKTKYYSSYTAVKSVKVK